MKKSFLLALCISVLAAAFSFKSHRSELSRITNYYYFQGEKFYYSYKPDMVFVKFKQPHDRQSVEQFLQKYSEVDASRTVSYNDRAFVQLRYAFQDNSYINLIDRIDNEQDVESAGYTFTPLNSDDGKTYYGMSDEFIVQFKQHITPVQVNSINEQYNAEIIEQIDVSGGLTYLMKVKEISSLTAIDLSNKYYTDGLVNYAEPDLYCTNTLCDTTNDQYFYWQWAIRNLGNNVPSNPPGIITDCDMDVDSTWINSFGGDSSIKICVIDTGVDTNHTDLVNNMTHGLGWDYADNDPWPYDLGNHGTSCAGIAAAQGNNSIGISGIAFKCKIIPIRAIGGISAYHGYAYSFIRAWQVGSDVITNSWGQTGGASSLLYNAISDAARYGRGGKGCVITFASGNENGAMRFPAYIHPDVIVVGGLAPCNKRKSPSDGCSGETWGASYGSNLDLVAPCVKIYATSVGGGYTSSFNGTSSATPNAAGVCALLLSKNPTLTRLEVEAYLYLTCEKVGTYNYDSIRTYGMWNNEMGYGRLNSRLAMDLMLSQIDKTPPLIYHDNPVFSNASTGIVTTSAIIIDNRKLASGSNAPRLYYRVNNGTFNFLNAFQVSGDTFKFNIPGQVTGSKIDYYFAAQDTVSPANITTLPSGGSGINPPGSTPPAAFYTYWIGQYVVINKNVFKICPNNSTIYDTITVSGYPSNYMVGDVHVKVNVSHRTDSDVDLYLYKASSQSELTSDNGGSGDSYWNTVFDDSAATPITSGSAPFTGTYRPETPLSVFSGFTSPINGDWILRMDDDATGNFGTLDSWQLEIYYFPYLGGINTLKIPSVFKLYQNYPNPFNPVTKIRYDVPKKSFVKIIVYDIIGREVITLVNSNIKAGEHETEFDATNLSSGIYFYKMNAGSISEIKKMVVIK